MDIKSSVVMLMAVIAITGCSRSTNALNVNTRKPPQSLPSVPSGNLQSAELDPISESVEQPIGENSPLDAPTAPQVPGLDNGQNVEAVDTAALDTSNAKPLTHEPLAGSWNVVSDNSQCRAILAFTKWSGGYRATTLRCNSPELKTVTAWDVKGSKVVLVDSNGSQVASLASAGSERYSGTTSSGQPISFTR